MQQLTLKAIAFILCAAVSAQEEWATHSVWLDSANVMHAEWAVLNDDPARRVLRLQFTARCPGGEACWAGVGFSAKGSMAQGDFVIAHTQGGQVVAEDYHAPRNGYPVKDESQDYEVLSTANNGTHMVVNVQRPFVTCDEDDYELGTDTVRMLWAAGRMGRTGRMNQHSADARGSRSLHLLQDQSVNKLEDMMQNTPNVDVVEFTLQNAPVPSAHHTLYYCHVFSVPRRQRAHLIAFDAVVSPPTNNRFVHHMILYKCPASAARLAGKSGPCYDQKGVNKGDTIRQYVENEEVENPMDECAGRVIAGWAYGGEPFIFPDYAGLPLFDDENSESYFMIEMHYDNQDYIPNVTDNSGMRLYVTSDLRPVEAAQLVTGINPKPFTTIVPPRQKEYRMYSYCPMDCTLGLPEQGVQAFAGLLHTHLVGVQVHLRHIRAGRELKPLLSDKHYDFNYQNILHLEEPTTILPGDELITECVYDTAHKANVTLGGPATSDEMCLSFVYITSPRPIPNAVAMCMSEPKFDALWGDMGVVGHEVDEDHKVLLIMKDNSTIEGEHFLRTKIDWMKEKHNIPMPKMFERYAKHGEHGYLCNLGADGEYKSDVIPGPPEIHSPYVPPTDDVCASSARPDSPRLVNLLRESVTDMFG